MTLSTIFLLLVPKILVQGLFHEHSIRILEPPSMIPEHSFYGYSITSQNHSLIVSDPVWNGIGTTFVVDIDRYSDDSPNDSINITHWPVRELIIAKENNSVRHDLWFGASVKANKDFCVTCTPLHAEHKRLKGKKFKRELATIGICYLKPSIGETWRLKVLLKRERPKNKTEANLMDSFGWTLHITPQSDLLVGGPAASKGRVIIYKDPLKEKYKEPKQFEIKGGKNKVLYNFGYSITSGIFFGKEISYAVSSPYGNLGYGKVYFFNSKLKQIAEINDDTYNSLFGACLCFAMLPTGALVVGASVYADRAGEYDVGAVYIYMADTGVGSKNMILKQKIKGERSGGYFGHAILNLGDMDGDSMDEIAIAAPYEDEGKGAIYIYTGKGLLKGRHSQRLQNDGFKYFGFSMTTMQDYDDNGCNELAIASPISKKIVFLNSLAYITVKLRAVFPNSQNITLGKKFTFEACLDVTYPEKPKDIEAVLIISIESLSTNVTLKRSGIENSELKYEESVKTKKPSYCQSIGVATPNITEKAHNLVLVYKMSAKLKENPLNLKEFDKSRVLLSENSKLNIEDSVWNSVCKSNSCIPILTLVSSCSISRPYVIGSTKEEKLNLTITNKGENAYSACVVVTIPTAHTIRYPKVCVKETTSKPRTSILCKPETLLKIDQPWIIPNIIVETNYLTSLDDTLDIMYDLYDNCLDQSGHQTYADKFSLTSDFDGIFITGKTVPDELFYLTMNDIQYGKITEHHYTIYNNGTTNWINVQCEITLENATFIKYSEAPITINTGSSLIECAMSNSTTAGNITVLCDVGDLRINEKVVVVVSMEIPPESIGVKDENKNITISTSLNLLLKDKSKNFSLQTVLRLHRSEVPLWVIIVAPLIGGILVCVLGYILYKSGFLRRKNKENLRALKKSVYRQSMQRTAMRESMRATATRRSTNDLNFLKSEASFKSD